MSLSHPAGRRLAAGGFAAAFAALAAVAASPACAASWPSPAYLAPLDDIEVRDGHLAWDGVVVGMTFREVARELGRLPAPSPEPQMLCPLHRSEAVVAGQRLGLDFTGTGDDAVLRSITVLLSPGLGESFDTRAVVAALRERLDLEWVPSPHAPRTREADLEKPLYRTAAGELVFVNPESGVAIGSVCVD